MKLFYLVWVDLIIRARSQPANKNDWRFMTFMLMSVIMGIDLLFIMVIIQEAVLGYYFYKFEISALPQVISNLISFSVLFITPPLVLNYILIFRNHRYEKLIEKYQYHNGKLALTFMLLGLFIPGISLLFGMLYGII
jgi:membrane protein YdbS with pleckstrin-like domain